MPQPRNGVEWCQPTNANQSQSLIKRGCACPHSSSASPPSLTPPKTALGPDRALLQLGKTWLGPSLCSAQWPSLQQQPQQRHPRWPVRLGGLSQEVCRRGRGRADRAVGRPSCHRALSHSLGVCCVVCSGHCDDHTRWELALLFVHRDRLRWRTQLPVRAVRYHVAIRTTNSANFTGRNHTRCGQLQLQWESSW